MNNLQKYIQAIFNTDTPSEKITKACELAVEANNLPQISKVHSFYVAEILAKLRLDQDTLIATLLSDRNLEPYYPSEHLKEIFGSNITKLVEGIRALNQFELHPNTISSEIQNERIRQMLLAMTSDIRIMIIKLAYRVARLRNLKQEPAEVRTQIAQETQLIFAPLANRLGISQLKWEMEDLSFRYLHPNSYKSIATQLASKRTEREAYIENMLHILKEMFADRHFNISGRPKHIYSIWKKMNKKGLSIDALFDLRAVRIYVDSIQECYEVLGAVHSRWHYVKEEFDDYIASPKENGYQSIHTVIYGPENKTVEIQIRTHEMHRHAEYGVAAHWKYKEGNQKLDQGLEKSISLVRQLLEYNDNPDLLNEVSTELLSEHIYVMTPKKEVITLRKNHTPLDFAYQIHTELGHRCRGAKVNGKIVPLTYQLKTGDEVEILTINQGTPNRNWLNPSLGYLASSRSRNKVRSWFNHQNKETNITTGEALYQHEVKRLHAQKINLKAVLNRLQFDTPDALFEALGKGRVNERQLQHAIQKELAALSNTVAPKPTLKKALPEADKPSPLNQAYVIGAPQLNTHLAPCCSPKRGDEILGFVTRGRGITIHQATCANILNLSHEEAKRLIAASWEIDANQQPENQCQVQIAILAFDRKGLLKDIVTCLMAMDINITASNAMREPEDHSVQINLQVEMPIHTELSLLLDEIEKIQNIESAYVHSI